MNPEPENFDRLGRLLALKKHEQPPPGYFNRFSSEIIARIEAGETGEVRMRVWSVFGPDGWMQRLWGVLDARPLLAGGVGLGICAVFAAGVIFSESNDSADGGLGQSTMGVMQASAGGGSFGGGVSADPRAVPAFAGNALALGEGSNSLHSAGALFETLESLQPKVSQASFPLQQQ